MTTTTPAGASDSIADRVAGFHASAATQMPPQALAAFSAEQVSLAAAGTPPGVARTGTVMPDGLLLDVQGQPTSLAQVRGGRPAVVVFYRGAWCPYCNIALRSYQADLAPALAERGIALIAVSPQKPDGSLSISETNGLTYIVVSDPANQLARALGILTAPTADAQAAQASLGLDLADHNADGTRNLPMPTTVVVDPQGVITWIDVHPNYATRTEPATILAAVSETLQSRPIGHRPLGSVPGTRP
jgi:peroxiredoxin